jgi:lipopolysaccharide transport system permease protein
MSSISNANSFRLGRPGDVWRYREAIRALALLSLRVRYNNSMLGFLWSLGNPLFFAAIFTFVFTVVTPSGIKNYPVFVLSALLPWNFFQTGMMSALSSISGGRELITKLSFPREILPLASVLAEGVNFSAAMLVITLLLIPFGLWPGNIVFLLPLLVILLAFFTAGVGMLLATLNVWLRDTEEFMKVFTFGWFFLTPIVYSLDSIPMTRMFAGIPVHDLVIAINPISTLIIAFRDILYNQTAPSLSILIGATAISLITFAIGFVVFWRSSARFAEAV